jgi:hypothetical protein
MDTSFNLKDFPPPAGFSFDKYDVKHVEASNTVQVTLPVLLTWTRELAVPETNDVDGAKKWIVGFAIPKAEGAKALAAIKAACDTMMKADGHKAGAYPHCVRDGGAKDGNGMFVKSGGKLADWAYCTAKTKRVPRLLEKASSGMLEIEATKVQAGTYAYLAANIIAIGYGEKAGNKRGTSCWFNKILWLGGGNPIVGGGARSDEEDFGSVIGDIGENADSTKDAAAGFF